MNYRIKVVNNNQIQVDYTPAENPVAAFIGCAQEFLPEHFSFSAITKAGNLQGPFESLEELASLLDQPVEHSLGEVIQTLRATPDLLSSPLDCYAKNFVEITAFKN